MVGRYVYHGEGLFDLLPQNQSSYFLFKMYTEASISLSTIATTITVHMWVQQPQVWARAYWEPIPEFKSSILGD